MIGFRILNKSKQRTALLVHGMFTNSGYWLPYLSSLKEHRLIILNIDYRAIRDVGNYVSRAVEIIEAMAAGEVDAVIAHSAGSLISSLLPLESRRYLFEVCPVYCATRINEDKFVEEIHRKIKNSLLDDEIRSLLREVDAAIASHSVRTQASVRQSIYLPDVDTYFSYHGSPASRQFRGDHFDISEAVADIGKVLSS